MTDKIKGLKIVKNDSHPALSTSAKNPDYNKKPKKHPVMPKPKQAKHTGGHKPNSALKPVEIPDESPESDRARGRDRGMDGSLNNLRKDAPSKRKGTSRRRRRSQRLKELSGGAHHETDLGQATAYLAAILNTPPQPGEPGEQDLGRVPVAPSVPANDGPRRSGGIPITRGRGR